MNDRLRVIDQCPLFGGIAPAELRTLLGCLMATERSYEKGDFIFMADQRVESVGVVLSGSIHVIQEDFWGNRSILANISPGGLFGEAFSCAETEKLPVSVVSAVKSDILLIDYRRIITSCPSACGFHTDMIKNMLRILALKNILLTQKIEHVTQRTTRAKLLSYLSAQAMNGKNAHFEIPFNRQELADYLSVDRSALSSELGKMRDDGILQFEKNQFKLLQAESL